MKGKKRIGSILINTSLLLVIVFTACLTGCSSSKVSKQQIMYDLQESNIFSIHDAQIQEFNIIKRMSDVEEDVVYVNAKGANGVYSVSLNFKMTYLLYDDGWRLETVEEYEDEKNIDEIIPLSGPTQEDVDEFIEQQNWNCIASFPGWLESDVTFEIASTEDISLGSFYGHAKYTCTVICEYPYVLETVKFPINFIFTEAIGKYHYWDWEIPNQNDGVSQTERSVELKPSICTNWSVEGTVSNGFRSAYVKTGFHIKELDLPFAIVDSYYFYDGDEKKRYEATGTMRLFSNKDQETGKISSLKLQFFADSKNPPKQCADLYFENSKALKSTYEYSLGIFEYPIWYTARD